MALKQASRHPEYYEAILQLRDSSPEVVKFAQEDIRRQGAGLARVKKVRGGTDFYLVVSSYAKSLGKKLQQQFGGELLITASLFSRREGKAIYRITVLFRGIPFGKGDLVVYRGEEWRVLGMQGGVFLQPLAGGKKARVKWKEIGRIRKVFP